jgi:hypothetical protein
MLDEMSQEQFDALLARKRRELRGLEEVYAARFGDTPAPPARSATHYATVRPIFAIVAYLQKSGSPVRYEQMFKDLIEGGAALGRQDPELALRKSVNFNVRSGKLTCDGRIAKDQPCEIGPDTLIGLPEWLEGSTE